MHPDTNKWSIQKIKGTSSNELAMISPNAKPCNLHIMMRQQLPTNKIELSKYKGQYCFLKKKQELYYIEQSGQSTLVNIKQKDLFEKRIEEIAKEQDKKSIESNHVLYLDSANVKDIITSNGGHTNGDKIIIKFSNSAYVYSILKIRNENNSQSKKESSHLSLRSS